MSAAAEKRYAQRVNRTAGEQAAEARHQDILSLKRRGVYLGADQQRETAALLRDALVQWNVPRPTTDYATRKEAVQNARALGPWGVVIRAFTTFESFWVAALIRPGGVVSATGCPLMRLIPATPEEIAAIAFRRPPRHPVYRMTRADPPA